ncbi:MAG: hypothetical protein JW915_10200 [Chitinispirillaceae bacterium]|nr:hypothetical protein [Chitinispirillaceae bacterium]
MDTKGCLVDGPEKRCFTMSPKIAVQWDRAIIYCGFRAAYNVTLTGVNGNTTIHAFCRTSDGNLIEKSELHTSLTSFMNQVLIPFDVVSGTAIYIEVLLPEYEVLCKSDCKPAYNSLSLKAHRIMN